MNQSRVLRESVQKLPVPLLPYLLPGVEQQFELAITCALGAQFAVGAGRSLVTAIRWWVSGLEMLGLGAVVAAVAYGTGALISTFGEGGI